MFRNIGVKLVNIKVSEERLEFENNINRLLEEITLEEQEKKLIRIWKKYG
jgi:hypothetical protein